MPLAREPERQRCDDEHRHRQHEVDPDEHRIWREQIHRTAGDGAGGRTIGQTKITNARPPNNARVRRRSDEITRDQPSDSRTYGRGDFVSAVQFVSCRRFFSPDRASTPAPMDDPSSESSRPDGDASRTLEARVDRLEEELRTLRTEVSRLADAVGADHTLARDAVAETLEASGAAAAGADEAVPDDASPEPEGRSLARQLLESENWLNLIGIGLLIFGVIFLFKYSIDQGWITPPVRVIIGAAVGAALVGAGLWLQEARARLAQVLLGGGIAALYTSIFATYQLYTLLPYGLAFACMVGITAVAFGLSVQQDRPVLAVIGAAGGFGTPFLLYAEGGTLAGLAGYTSLVLIGSFAIYWRHAWASLAWTAFVGGVLALMVGNVDFLFGPSGSVGNRWAFQGAAVVLWATAGLVPALRAVDAGRSTLPGASSARWTPAALAVGAPLIALALTDMTWRVPGLALGLLALGSAIGYVGAAMRLRGRASARLAQAHGLVAAALAAVAWSLFFEGPLRFLFFAVEAASLLALARWQRASSYAWAGRALLAWVALFLFDYLTYESALRPPLLNGPSILVLLTLCCGAIAAAIAQVSTLRVVYAAGTHILALAWLLHQFVPLPNGQAYASIAWAVYALLLLAAGVRSGRLLLRQAALGTLLLLVAKLFFVDLAQLGALWRILLFLGIGAGFLVLSYAFPALWSAPEEAGPSSADADVET